MTLFGGFKWVCIIDMILVIFEPNLKEKCSKYKSSGNLANNCNKVKNYITRLFIVVKFGCVIIQFKLGSQRLFTN